MQYKKEKLLSLNNKEIYKISFTNDNNYSVEFFNYGGYFHKILIPYSHNNSDFEDVILGYDNINGYINDKISLNAIVGRVCGRIRNAKFELNNKTYFLTKNDQSHHIHGGKNGFSKKIWNIEEIIKNENIIKCKLSLKSEHLEEGYPGNLNCFAVYSLNNNNELRIDFSGFSDQDTIINLTNHNYWNFHGHNSYYQNIKNHMIQINSRRYCELDSDYLPSGKLKDVFNSKYDFNKIKKINGEILNNKGIDNCYEIENNNKLYEISKVYSCLSKMGMKLYTDQPGLQFYTGNMMEIKYDGKYNKDYGYQHGFCMECQFFPDAINNLNFKSPILRANHNYSSTILMKFFNDF